MGERIDATLGFSNDDTAKPYSLAVGTGTPGAFFIATDSKGQAAPNPRLWYYGAYGICIMGPVGMHVLGTWTLTLPVNQSVRFDHPGTYTLFAASPVTEGDDSIHSRNGTPVWIVSEKTTVTIEPLTPDEEKQTISAALSKLSTPDGDREGIGDLGYLGTSVAIDQLISLIGNLRKANQVGWALIDSPDPYAAAERILNAVNAGRLILDEDGISFYIGLKSYRLVQSAPHGPDGKVRIDFDGIRKAAVDVRTEIVNAQKAVSAPGNPHYLNVLWTAYQVPRADKFPGDPDADGSKERAALARHQLELPPEYVRELFDKWPELGSPDFLPLVQREIRKDPSSPEALLALAAVQPDTARPLIIKDLLSKDSRLLGSDYPADVLLPLQAPLPLPQLDTLFRFRLSDAWQSPSPIVPLIESFGSDEVLRQLLEAFPGRVPAWGTAMEARFFRYCLSRDPAAASAALAKAVDSLGTDGWSLLKQTLDRRSFDFKKSEGADILTAIQSAFEGPDPLLLLGAYSRFQYRGTAQYIDFYIKVLEDLKKGGKLPNFVSTSARNALGQTRWNLTAEERNRLEVIAGSQH